MAFAVAALFVVLSLVYFLLKRHYSYWEDRKIPGPKPWFIFGNSLDSVLMRKNPLQIHADIYKQFPNEPYVGFFNFFTPILLIRDPQLLRKVQVQDFKHFTDNAFEVDPKENPLFGRNPFMLKGDQWKGLRSLLSPCFTSGKMKTIYPLMENVAQNMINFIQRSKSPLEAKELSSKYTIDNVASCAFGLDANCFEDPKAEFRDLAHRFLSPDSVTGLKLFLMTLMPKLGKYIKVQFVPKDVEAQLMDIVKQSIEYRKSKPRNDFLQFLIDISPGDKVPKWDLEEITAQAATFFSDGFETSSIVLSLVLFDLACNPEIQERLRSEIRSISNPSQKNKFDYDALINCSFLEACILETMRRTPIFGASAKTVTEKYTLIPSDSEGFSKSFPVTLNVGDLISIATGGMHLDAKYFPNPQIYNPDRFMGENKSNIQKYTFQPFGEGPRACLGQRFGMLQIKVALAVVVQNFEMTMNKKTQLPLKMLPSYIMPSPVGGLWIDFKKIE